MNFEKFRFRKINEPSDWLITSTSINWELFFKELIDPTVEFTIYIKKILLSAELNKRIDGKENNLTTQEMLIKALNSGMVNRVFYDPWRTGNLEMLDIQTKSFVANSYKLKNWQLVRANRIILETQYPKIIQKKFSRLEVIRDKARKFGVRLDRRWKLETTAFRLLPSFLIAGVQRCGTSSLFYYLSQHPNIVAPEQKELHFFNRPDYSADLQYYKSLFPLRHFQNKMIITGEATPEYSFYPTIMQYIQQVLPEIKIILIVRDPVQRAISHYYAQVPHRRPESLRLAIEKDKQIFSNRDNSDFIKLDHYERGQNYIARGRYIDYIPSIYKLFPRQNILLLKAEDMFANPLDITNRCFVFLGIEKLKFLDIENNTNFHRENNNLLRSLQFVPEKPDEYLETELYRYFRPYNQMFYEFIQRDMGWGK